jgi:hypothetical protein
VIIKYQQDRNFEIHDILEIFTYLLRDHFTYKLNIFYIYWEINIDNKPINLIINQNKGI